MTVATTTTLHRADLARLVQAAAAGDHGAFGALVARHRPLVARVAARCTTRAADADDVVQETWVQLWRHVGAIEQPEALAGWLRRVATNAAFRMHARNARLVASDLDDVAVADDAEDLGLRSIARAETRIAVGRAVGRLRAPDRRLVELLMAEDRPDYRAVSRAVDRPVGSIGPTRQRILDRLRRDPAITRLASAG
jgi:RNA polymerase sigma factor (sigma-70 family)